MKNKHTPGPWVLYRGQRNDLGLPTAYKQSQFIGLLADGSGLPVVEFHLGNIQANAALIATAPEMLKALMEVLEYAEAHGEMRDLIDIVAPVIVKATGE